MRGVQPSDAEPVEDPGATKDPKATRKGAESGISDDARRATDRRITAVDELDELAWNDRGLVPVVAQDVDGGRVLMVAWANREALELTLATGEVHFWSRSRRELWRKGETSGNVLRLRSLHADCDADTVLALVSPTGPACHTGETSCFGRESAPAARTSHPDVAVLADLWRVIETRAAELPGGSYTTKLLTDENLRLKKLGEETAELVTALAKADPERGAQEAADLLYHLLAALRGADVPLARVLEILGARRK